MSVENYTAGIRVAAAIDGVARELAEEIAWRYEGSDVMAASESVARIEAAAQYLKSVNYQPSQSILNLIERYSREQN